MLASPARLNASAARFQAPGWLRIVSSIHGLTMNEWPMILLASMTCRELVAEQVVADVRGRRRQPVPVASAALTSCGDLSK